MIDEHEWMHSLMGDIKETMAEIRAMVADPEPQGEFRGMGPCWFEEGS